LENCSSSSLMLGYFGSKLVSMNECFLIVEPANIEEPSVVYISISCSELLMVWVLFDGGDEERPAMTSVGERDRDRERADNFSVLR